MSFPGSKRKRVGDEEVPSFSVSKPAVTDAATRAGYEFTQPRVFEQPQLDNYGETRVRILL